MLLFAIAGFPGFITGVIVSTARWLLLAGSATGLIAYILPISILLAGMIIFYGPPNVEAVEFLQVLGILTLICGGAGILSGLSCGAMLPRQKISDLALEPPPPEHFNFD